MSNAKPILFKDEMIRAILEGRKTQTRRVVKGAPVNMVRFIGADDKPTGEFGACLTHDLVINKHVRCPYGKPGDRLWVRENFLQLMHGQVTDGRVKYCASIDPRSTGTPKNDGYWWRKRPSIHMPRWASRITLEITDVRVERLQDISSADAKAEGVATPDLNDWCDDSKWVSQFAWLWRSINGPDSWDANPWVWVVEFKRVDQKGI